jgi:prepilin-type N-terminal cleavage/methylation domain-containing protein
MEREMKKTFLLRKCAIQGFSLLEVLMSLAIIAIIAGSIFVLQTNSWKRASKANRTIVAGHMVERQIEAMRMSIENNPKANFPPLGGSISENGISLSWQISNAKRPKTGATLTNVSQCDFIASWGSGKDDTLRVTTFLSEMF